SEIAVARPARTPGGQPRHRSASAQPGRDARALEADRRPHPARLRIREIVRAAALRSESGQTAPDRGGLPQRFRRRRLLSEALVSYLQTVGIKSRVRIMERAALTTAWREKKLKNLIVGITGAAGNAATRLEAYVSKEGAYTAGIIPEVEDLFQRQAREIDVK